MKNIHEIFDEFELANSDNKRIEVLRTNHSETLLEVLKLAFHPGYQWLVTEMPDTYKVPDTLPGVSHARLSTELRRLYLFQKGHPTAEKLHPQKRKELLTQLLESLEPRETEVIMGIFNKDLGVRGLTVKFVRDYIPSILS